MATHTLLSTLTPPWRARHWPLRWLRLGVVLCSAFTAALTPASAPAKNTPGTARQALHAFFAAEWERSLRESPETASVMGDSRFDERWTDYRLAAIAAREAADRQALKTLRALPRAALAPADRLHYDTFAWLLQHKIERAAFREVLQPISHQEGVQTADALAESLPFRSVADYEHWIARLRALPALVDQTLDLMRAGLAEGQTPPRVLLQRVSHQIAAQIVSDATQSPFYRPLLRFDAAIPAAERARLESTAQSVILQSVVPAFTRLQTYFSAEYLPQARTTVALADAPNGRAYYDFLARYYTSTNLSADEIHDIGLQEVQRLKADMQRVQRRTGFAGTLPEFFQHLRSDPRFYYPNGPALLDAYRAMAKRIDPELVKVFRVLPRQPYGVRAIPDNVAPDTTTAYYLPGAPDGSRAGQYYVNLYRPEVRPRWEMVPLTLHEAVPGHHFQFARALEMPDTPMFRKTAYFVAYGEGWALYAEQLGFEMGLYDDPYDHFGQLTYEMWRAVRLVVDTGMHAKGWSRERAIAYFQEHVAKTEQDIVNEIDRYIGTPGQALAYKIGQMRISLLRARAQQELGQGFDLRDFNDAVLTTGSVPLQALEQHINAWIDAQRRAGRKTVRR